MNGELTIFFIASVAIFIGASLQQKGNGLIQHGQKARAIIFKNNYASGKNGGIYYPVVRFLTDKQEWITQELSIGSSLKRKEGSEVTVIYDPDDPHSVEIDIRFRLRVLPKLLFVSGLIGLIILALELLDITQLIE